MNIFFFFLFFPCLIFSHNIVFVHLGNSPPPSIFTSMKQARFLNQDCDIYLLTDKGGYLYFQTGHEKFFADEYITLIDAGQLPITEEHATFHNINQLDGFWSYATERFFSLFDFIKAQNLIDIVHLENDSMLYLDLDELYPLFKKFDTRLAAPFQSLKGCIPCFVFIKDSESLAYLIEHILSEMGNYHGTNAYIAINDMQTLASFYVKFGGDYLTPLPTLMPEYALYHHKRKSLFSPDNFTPLKFLSQNSSLFTDYIFDAAGLGIFLNSKKQIHFRSLFTPHFFSYSWGEDSKGRTVPYLSFKGKKYQIVNLHFPSKAPEEFTSFLPFRKELL